METPEMTETEIGSKTIMDRIDVAWPRVEKNSWKWITVQRKVNRKIK
jgi:hypothetical protein